MTRAEILMEDDPESSLSILDSINPERLKSSRDKARYSLLKSIAIDKNYIDTTTFDILQPAIDYYLKKGTPDEKLRTLYYQGRIYQNRGEDEEAMKCLIQAIDQKENITDSMVLARTYIAQALLYKKQGVYNRYINNAIHAQKIYKKLNKPELEFDCLIRALNGNVWMGNKIGADSILFITDSLSKIITPPANRYLHSKLIYTVDFIGKEYAKELLDSIDKTPQNEYINLDLAYGYHKLGENDKALFYITKVHDINSDNELKYLSIKSNILEAIGKYDASLSTFKEFINIRDSINSETFSQEILSVKKKYDLEQQIFKDTKKKYLTVFIFISLLLVFTILLIFTGYRLRGIKIKNLLLNEEQKRLKNENEHILKESEKLKVDLVLIQEEREIVVEQLNNQKELSENLNSLIRERLNILNGLLASHITSNDELAKEYDQLISDLSNNKARFLKLLRENFKASYPDFFNRLYECGLTETEINYVCLYAIGLKGKEIGIYLETKSHYNISSNIRNKLNLNPNGTNLGSYIQSQIH